MSGIGGRGRRAAAVYDPSRRAPAGPSARPICAMCACAPAAALKGAPRVRGRWGRGRGWGQLVGMAASQTAGDAWEEDVRLVVLRYGDVADLWPVIFPVPISACASPAAAAAAAAARRRWRRRRGRDGGNKIALESAVAAAGRCAKPPAERSRQPGQALTRVCGSDPARPVTAPLR